MTHAATPAEPTIGRRLAAASLRLRTIAATLLALFVLDNIILLGLLGVSSLLVFALALIMPPVLAILVIRTMPGEKHIAFSTIFVCLAIAAILLMLGGEGRLFFATDDWQIRDAVLADMGTHRWPFDYWLDGQAQMLRAPVGMYLVPALIGGASQLGRDWVLLAHNSLILGLVLMLGSALFKGRRAQLIALVTFITFSGLDVIGTLIHQSFSGEADWEHIERWAYQSQYSAHITQIFWVPHHAFAGWACAITYLLWRRGLAPIGLFGASLPLVALWSPLVLFGALPFAAFAGIRTLLTGAWDKRDILLCIVATAVAIPALLYLATDAQTVGGGIRPLPPAIYILVMLLEVVPFILPLLRDRDVAADRATVMIAGICLLLMPLWKIGSSTDFQMRASIMPLALVAIAFADWANRLNRLDTKAYFLTIIALASLTGMVEIARVFRFAPSPVPHCSLAGIWSRQTGLIVPHAAYFAARGAFPFNVIPADRVSIANPDICWDQQWRSPRRGL
ncbi:MAG TPA: hypothetical protein VF463_06970 [Sphingobium sp.]